MELKDEIKEFGYVSLDMDRIGVTNAEMLSGAPEGYRPTDILPGAKSVIVMGVRLSLGAVQTIYRAHEEGLRHLQCIYGTHGYALTPNYHLKFAAYRLRQVPGEEGISCYPTALRARSRRRSVQPQTCGRCCGSWGIRMDGHRADAGLRAQDPMGQRYYQGRDRARPALRWTGTLRPGGMRRLYLGLPDRCNKRDGIETGDDGRPLLRVYGP